MHVESSADVVVLGGGVAGLSVAAALRARGRARVTLLEQEPMLASQASARNAAIFLPVERDAVTTALVVRQSALLDELFAGTDDAWLDPIGALLVSADAHAARSLTNEVVRNGLRAEYVDRDEMARRSSVLADGEALGAVYVAKSGILNTHGMISLLTKRVRELSVAVHSGVGAARVELSQNRVRAVVLADGTRIHTSSVVVAGGAWAESIGTFAGLPLPLVPLKRHLFWLRADVPESIRSPVVWRFDDEVYFRPESGGILASPCDERPTQPSIDPVEEADAKDALADKLQRLAPSLLERGVRRSWACLRTYAPDRLPVLGRDPRAEGVAWFAGLGGQGMSICLAAAEVVAADVAGGTHPLLDACRPDRLLAGAART